MIHGDKKCIVIGSGIAGLAAAIRARVLGYEVDIYEKNSYAGGKLSAFETDGFHFDAGPSLFTQPENVTELFRLAGENPDEYFTFKEVPVSCQYFYPDGTRVSGFTDIHALASELYEKFGEPKENIYGYAREARNSYDNIGTLFLDYSLHRPDLFLWKKMPKALAHTKKDYIFSTLHDYNHKSFLSAKTVQLFDRFATYNGSNPYAAPGMLSMIPHLELGQGTYYPEGGMISITNALLRLAEKLGITLYLQSETEKIVVKNKAATGVIVDGEEKEANVVISNMDVYYTYKNLLQNENYATKILKQERSSSALIFYWGLNRTFDHLGLHNIFFSRDYKREFDSIFSSRILSDDPTVYINITSKMEEHHAPKNMENWFVMVNTFHHKNDAWDLLTPQIREHVIRKLNEILEVDLEKHIITESTLDPFLIQEKTASYTGSLYGTSSNSKTAAFLRHPNFSKDISGLYFVGGSVHPGGGIPLCLRSAKIVQHLLENERHGS